MKKFPEEEEEKSEEEEKESEKLENVSILQIVHNILELGTDTKNLAKYNQLVKKNNVNDWANSLLRGICTIELEGKNDMEKMQRGVHFIDEALELAKEEEVADLKDGVLEKITTIMRLAHKVEYLQTLERNKIREEGMIETV